MQPSGDRLALVYRVSQAFNSSLDLDRVLNTVIDEVIRATRAERGFVVLRAPDGELLFRAARGMEQRTIESPEFQVSRGVVQRVAEEGRPLLTSNAQSDSRLGGRASVINLGLRSILCVPLQIKGASIGVIYVDNRLQAGIFTIDDLDLLVSIATSAAIAIDNARLYQVAVEKGRMERELQVAHEMQASLLPKTTPQIAGWEVEALWWPEHEVAGDYYDFLITERHLSVVIADVADKGVPAALFMASTRSTVRTSVTHSPSPAYGLTRANRFICDDASGGMFVTLFFGQIDVQTGVMIYTNAGHNPPLVYDADQGQVESLDRHGLALGIDPDMHYADDSVHLDSGDCLLLYTDGVTEAMNDRQEQFGSERLRKVFRQMCHNSSPHLLAPLEQSLRDFIGAAPQVDDVTVVLVKRSA